MTDIRNFFERVSADAALQQQLAEALADKDEEESLQTIAELVRGLGISREDVASVFEALQGRENADRELDTAELENVTGGLGSIHEILKKIDSALYRFGF